MAGIKNPVADQLIEQIIAAESLEQLQVINRALDRVLLWNHYVIPQFFSGNFRFAHWNRFGKPDTQPKYLGSSIPGGWWLDSELDSKLDLKR